MNDREKMLFDILKPILAFLVTYLIFKGPEMFHPVGVIAAMYVGFSILIMIFWVSLYVSDRKLWKELKENKTVGADTIGGWI